MIIDSFKEQKANEPIVPQLLIFVVCTWSLALFVVACACCKHSKKKEHRISGNEATAAQDGISPAPTIIRPDYYRRHPRNAIVVRKANKVEPKVNDVEPPVKTADVDCADPQKKKDTDIAITATPKSKMRDAVPQEVPKMNVDTTRAKRQGRWRSRMSMFGQSRSKNFNDAESALKTKSTAAAYRTKQDAGSSRSKFGQSRNKATTAKLSPLEFASHLDPAYMTIGLDVEDPFSLRPLESIRSQRIVGPTPKRVLEPPLRMEKMSVFV